MATKQKTYSCGDTAKVKLMEPYAHIHGKISKNSDVVLAVVNGKQSIHRISPRNLIAKPLSQDEQDARDQFSTRAKEVTERMKSSSPTYIADLAAYAAQTEYNTLRSYLWAKVKQEGK